MLNFVKIFLTMTLYLFSLNSSGVLLNKALDAFYAGDIRNAEKSFQSYYKIARKLKNDDALYDADMALGWFYNEISRPKQSLSHCFSALRNAQKNKLKKQEGRSLSFIGWNLSNLGFYKAATKYFERAILIGKGRSAAKGYVRYPIVWGLATQELGNLYRKKGDTKKAKKLISETYEFAKEENIAVGISESGAYLSLIELEMGNIGAALKLAKVSLSAGKKCDCSNNNLARSYYVLAKSLLSKYKKINNQDLRNKLDQAIIDSIDFSERNKNSIYFAKSLILKAALIEDSNPQYRIEILDQAISILKKMESPDVVVGFMTKAQVLIDDEVEGYGDEGGIVLANELLKEGLKVSSKVGNHLHLTHLTLKHESFYSQFKKKHKVKIKDLITQSNKSKKQGQFPLWLKTSKILKGEFLKRNLRKMAIVSSKEAVKACHTLFKREKNKKVKKEYFEELSQLKRDLAGLLAIGAEVNRYAPGAK